MENDVTPTRRHVVTAGAATTLGIAAAAALSACSGSGGQGGAGSSSATAAGASGGSAARAAGGSAGTPKPPTVGSASSPSAGPLAKLAAVPVGGAIAAKGPDGTPIVIVQPQAGKVVAFSAVCTHQGCSVVPAGQQLLCPCHNSTFDLATGAVRAGLAPAPLPAVAVKVVGEDVVAG